MRGSEAVLSCSMSVSVFRHPVVIGGGTPYLPPVTDALPLELMETKGFRSGVVYERYRCSGAVPGAGLPAASIPAA